MVINAKNSLQEGTNNISDYIFVTNGTKITPLDGQFYTYEFYSLKRPWQFLYTYTYSPDEAYLTHENCNSLIEEKCTETIFEKTGFVKIHSSKSLNFKIEGLSEEEYFKKQAKIFLECESVKKEIQKTSSTVSNFINNSANDKLYFTLLTDTHYALNCNFEQTFETICAVNNAIKAKTGKGTSGIIHLGDFTDGMLSKDICKKFTLRVLNALKTLALQVIVAVGNHDCNYFKQNKDLLSQEEIAELYLEPLGIKSNKKNYYSYFVPNAELVFFVLDSYKNDEQKRYGYTQEQIDWLKNELNALDKNYKVIILSHEAPLASLDYWTNDVRNGQVLCDMLDNWNKNNGERILGFIHGHTHADFVCNAYSFAIVSVGCSKIEYFEKFKRDGFISAPRYENDVTQELWDILVVDLKQKTLDFVRFGAGFDRHISNKIKVPKVWAHRGSSGSAPENTLEAFALAIKDGADGVEFDVQMTKDGKLVVIHDETIDRVSDSKGFVSDFTYEELKKFNFNKTHPEYKFCHIPLLEEVLSLFKPTKLILNIELKTSINFYAGIEKAVLDMVHQFKMQERVIYSSFNHESVMRLKALDKGAKTAFLYVDGIVNLTNYAKIHKIDALHPSFNNLKYPFFIEDCVAQGLEVNTWTVNTKDQMLKCQQYGVNAIITNYPAKARTLYQAILNKDKSIFANAVMQEEPCTTNACNKKHSFIMHLFGVAYGKVRKIFVCIDKFVQAKARG